jgi:trehalose 6-phosphate synthase
VRINPHDIDGMKDAIMRAIYMPAAEQGRRMRALRKRVIEHDVARWSRSFLAALDDAKSVKRRADARRASA